MKAISATSLPAAPVIVWFRSDLRTGDNLALATAAGSGQAVIPLHIRENGVEGLRPLGGARKWWLHHSLRSLSDALDKLGASLVLRSGNPRAALKEIIAETGAKTVLWNRRYTPEEIEFDIAIKAALRDDGMTVESFEGHILHEPTRIRTGAGAPYKVYTPFWKALTAGEEPRPPVSAPDELKPFDGTLASDDLEDWNLMPTDPDWSGGIAEEWTPGETGAHDRLDAFLTGGIDGYGDKRDIPGIESTSRLSPHLAFGEITPFQIWRAANDRRRTISDGDRVKFLKEVAWREFSYHLLVNFPSLRHENFNEDFDAFAWKGTGADLTAWQKGLTGYPIVDAGMRQLWQTGWMHNRVRMVVGSFLVKHLLIDWRDGEDWFWDTLVDADPASNAASWQWIAGSGADAAPYFRIFNPILQGQKFDPDGDYVRKYVPELSDLPAEHIHKPWDAPASVLEKAGVKLSENYPRPMVEHSKARDRAMAAYKSMKREAA